MACAIEAAVSVPWEDLVMQFVIKPLGIFFYFQNSLLSDISSHFHKGMNSFGFGSPVGGPIGHDEDDVPQPLHTDHPFLHPSFSVHSTLEDWMKFAKTHMSILKGVFQGCTLKVSQESLEFLQIPVSVEEEFDGNEPPNGYAMGWKTVWMDSAEVKTPPVCLWHFGTNFRYNAGIFLDKERDIMVVSASNSGSMVARLAMRCAFERLLEMAQKEG